MVGTRRSSKRKGDSTAEQGDENQNARYNKKSKLESAAEPGNSNTSEKVAKDNQQRSSSRHHDSKTRSNKGKEKVEDLSLDAELIQAEPIHQPSLPESTVTSDSEDEDSIDWETIQLPPRFDRTEDSLVDPASDQKPVYKDIEIVMESAIPRPVIKKSHWERAYQRNLREWIHHSHVVCLVAHCKIRNKWCSDHSMQSVCSSIIPEHVQSLFDQEITEASLKTGIKWLFKWWSEYMTITGPGLLTRPYTDFDIGLRGVFDAQVSDEHGDYIKNLDAFMGLLVTKSCTRDTNAQLFVAVLRACHIETRLICSLQPLPYKIPSAAATTKESITENDTDTQKPMFQYRPSYKCYVDPNNQLRQRKSKPPTIWAEVYCPDTQRWMTVDPIRQHIDSPSLMEPATLNRTTQLSWVLAFLDPNHVRDVTRRYTVNIDKAFGLRERRLTKREKEAGMKPWSEILLKILGDKPISKRDDRELELLYNNQLRQAMPTSVSAFKNHPLYALERHLLKFEVLHPNQRPVLGSIRGERIYPRSSVMTVSTAETFRKLGRVVKQGEQPVKMVKANAVTIEKRRMKEQAKQEGHDLMVACYGEWQTEPYVPPPVINGKLPKNTFGNIDLFTPAMLPQGATHVPIKGIGKMAKKLGLEFAEAVVDFEFVKMRAVPVIDGIVVPTQSKDILLEAWEEHEQAEAMKAIAKQEKDVYLRWRKLIKGLLIKARVDETYGKHQDKWANINQDIETTGAGFLPEDDDNDDDDE